MRCDKIFFEGHLQQCSLIMFCCLIGDTLSVHSEKVQVEIDLLTGAVTILRGDLVYDCGKSMNPAVDLGQVCSRSFSVSCFIQF